MYASVSNEDLMVAVTMFHSYDRSATDVTINLMTASTVKVNVMCKTIPICAIPVLCHPGFSVYTRIYAPRPT